ncbi:MAG: DUF4244 domain-containing protein [Actinobacteria bacterium]|nr:DUF4244 domain-containing protein [Actinomycetota bacterium]MBI3686367.1 DUF4244 domain-containing protein [Actinomycetota bacterium]
MIIHNEGRPSVRTLLLRLSRCEEGMTTAEYAVGTMAAVAFAAVLYKVVTSGTVLATLTRIVTDALQVNW